MSLRRLALFIIAGLLLTGCVVVMRSGVKPLEEIPTLEELEKTGKCPIYQPLQFAELPTIPPVTNDMVKDRDKAEEHLVELIRVHRRMIVQMKRENEAHYQEYLKACRDYKRSNSKR